MKKVLVKWRDTEAVRGWKSRGTVEEIVKAGFDTARSVGYLYKKNKKMVALVQSKHSGNLGELLMIPRECVKSIKRLK